MRRRFRTPFARTRTHTPFAPEHATPGPALGIAPARSRRVAEIGVCPIACSGKNALLRSCLSLGSAPVVRRALVQIGSFTRLAEALSVDRLAALLHGESGGRCLHKR